MNRSNGVIATAALACVLVACGGGGGDDGGSGGAAGGNTGTTPTGNAFVAIVQEVIDTPNASGADPRSTGGVAAASDEAEEPQAVRIN
ncbi:MAG: hypothetical protein ACKVQU_37160 [Burkholderiales bacterium]